MGKEHVKKIHYIYSLKEQCKMTTKSKSTREYEK